MDAVPQSEPVTPERPPLREEKRGVGWAVLSLWSWFFCFAYFWNREWEYGSLAGIVGGITYLLSRWIPAWQERSYLKKHHQWATSAAGQLWIAQEAEAAAARAERIAAEKCEREERLRRWEGVVQLTPFEFEKFVARLFSQEGYMAEITPRTHDGGIDVRIRKGRTIGIVQVKHRPNSAVGRPDVQRFYGVLIHEKAHQGWFVTSGLFTDEAREFSRGKKISLIDRSELQTMIRRLADESLPD